MTDQTGKSRNGGAKASFGRITSAEGNRSRQSLGERKSGRLDRRAPMEADSKVGRSR